MSVSRKSPKGVRFASFGSALVLFALFPREIGYQDIAALLARQPGVTERWQKQAFRSSLSTIRAATFSFSRPLGTSIRETASFQLASLDSRGVDVTGSLARNPLGQVIRPPQPYDFPVVDRTAKGDRLVPRAPERAQPESDAPADAASAEAADPQVETPPAISAPSTVPAQTEQPESVAALDPSAKPTEPAPLDPELAEALKQQPLSQYDAGVAPDAPSAASADLALAEPPTDGFTVQTARLFFGERSLGASSDRLQSWQHGEEPIIVMPGRPDPDMKATAALPGITALPDEGTSVVGKGEVTGPDQRPKSPAERMGLDDKSRPKQEKCLTEAIYFEARGEAVRGQMAVAQVVVNRAFSGFYPSTVCGVVYQNSHRHLACQFTFACDNVRDVVREPDMWERAKKIARETLDGRIWLPEVGKSTHYHAYWVRPSWVHEMKKMYKTGVHTFYRPRKWGDGSDAPSWGTPQQTAAISAELAAVKE